MEQIKKDLADILQQNIYIAPQVNGFVIHGAIEKIIEYFQKKDVEITETYSRGMAEYFMRHDCRLMYELWQNFKNEITSRSK